MFDVIVIGSGPAGSAAAKALVEKGYRVLTVERCGLPRYKSCSGMLIKKTTDLTERLFGEAVPHFVTCTPADNRGMILTDSVGREMRFEQEGLNVWRSAFDAWLMQKAVDRGAECRDRTSAIGCRPGLDSAEITLKSSGSIYTEQARYIIDCEGASGAFRRRLLGERRDCIVTFQIFCAGTVDLNPHYFYAYLQPELSGYDAWFNVKDGMLVLGVAAREADRIAEYYPRFLDYMRKKHGLSIRKEEKRDTWIMPRILPGCPIVYGNGRFLFAGEAAGFLNPMGEGISAALESGYAAACAVDAHFGDPAAVLAEYRRQTSGLKSYMERQWSLVSYLSENFRDMRIPANYSNS